MTRTVSKIERQACDTTLCTACWFVLSMLVKVSGDLSLKVRNGPHTGGTDHTKTLLSGFPMEAYRQCGVVHTPWMVLEGISLVARIGGDVSQEV